MLDSEPPAIAEATQGKLGSLRRLLGTPTVLPGVIWKNLKYPFTPQAQEVHYDRRMGIDTAGNLNPDELGLSGARGDDATGYAAIPGMVLDHLVGALEVDPRGFVFTDAGAGKGRAVLLAARHGFARCVGVEMSPRLFRIAQENARRFADRHPLLSPIEFVCADAAEYDWPAAPLVVFLYNPFGAAVMRVVAARLRQSFIDRPRRIIVIYYHALHADAFDHAVFRPNLVTDIPRDPTDRYWHRRFQAVILDATHTLAPP